jgi:hypothetical protein
MSQDSSETGAEFDGESHGLALGFRIFDDEGDLYFVEAEIASYVDDPEAIGATLVFHRLSGVDPAAAAADDEVDWDSWPLDIDDELTRDETASRPAQFESILRQLSRLTDDDLRAYLRRATTEGEEEEG